MSSKIGFAHRACRVASLAALLAAALAATACSSAPKSTGAVYAVRNKAAELAKLGDGFMGTGQYESARKYYDEALRASNSVDDLAGEAAALASMGRAYLVAGLVPEASSAFEASLERAVMAGAPAAQSAAKSGLGEALVAKGDWAGALAVFEEAAALAAPGGKDPKDEASSRALAVAVHDGAVAKASLGRADEAMADLARAESLNAKGKRWTELAANRYVRASMLAGGNRLEEALVAALSALEADKTAENGRGIAGDLGAAGRICERLGRKEEAFGYWRRSFDTALAVDDAKAARAALEALVPLAESLGRAGDATRYATLLARLDEAEGKALAPADGAR